MLSNLPDNQPASWNSDYKKSSTEQLNRARKRRSILNMIITMVTAAAFIAAGIITPNIFYSATNSEFNTLTQLTDTNNEEAYMHVFDEPVSLYPWSLYDEENTSELSYTQRSFLLDHNVPNFLISTMSAYGMDISLLPVAEDQTPYNSMSNRIIESFSYLATNPESGQGCYVINEVDFNDDGKPDIRCAVDHAGVIISLVFLSEPWAPPVDDSAQSDTPESTSPQTQEGAGPAATGSPGAGVTNPPQNEAPAEGSEEVVLAEGSSYALVLEGLETRPVGENLSIWSYVHLINLCANENGQTALGSAAATLDAGFTELYSGAKQSTQGETYIPTPILYNTETYALYIYDLPSDVRFILYYDTSSSRCVGFNLQQ